MKITTKQNTKANCLSSVLFITLISTLLVEAFSDESCGVNPNTGAGSCKGNLINEDTLQESEVFSSFNSNKNNEVLDENAQQASDSSQPTIKYRELFAQQGDEIEKYRNSFESGSNYTDYFDFTIDNGELSSLNKPRASLYPPMKWKNNNQGNYLHFLKVAYEKRLPVMFTTDGFVEGLTKSYHRMTKIFMEEVFIHFIRKFSDGMITFIRNNKDSGEYKSVRFHLDSVQTYYSLISSFCTKGMEEYSSDKDIEAEFKKWKSTVDSYTSNAEIYFMGKKKRVNYNIVLPRGYWRNTQRLSNIWQAISFMQVHRFGIEEDVKQLWMMGKLIHDAGLYNQFLQLSQMIKYFIGQDSILPSIVDIVKYGMEEGIVEYTLTKENINTIQEICKKKRNKLRPVILEQMIMWSKESYEAISVDREKTANLISPAYSIVDWIINKVTDLREEADRRIISYYEINQAITQNRIKNNIIKNRMKGVKTNAQELYIELRDKVDYSQAFEAVDKIMNNTYVLEKDSWKENTLNHFYYLMYKANIMRNDTYEEMFRLKEIKTKNYNLGVSGAAVFNNQIKIFSRYMKSKVVEGGIPELYIEPNIEFYDEALDFINILERNFHIFTEAVENSMKVNFRFVRTRLSKTIDDIRYAIKLIKSGIKAQDESSMTESLQKELRELIYAEEISETWDGWFTRLYDIDNQMGLFNYEAYASFVHTVPADSKKGFPGISLFIYNKFNNIGICRVKDEQEKVEKLMLWSGSNFGEMYFTMDKNIDFEGVKNKIISRT